MAHCYPGAETVFPSRLDVLQRWSDPDLFKKMKCSCIQKDWLDGYVTRKYEIDAAEYYYISGRRDMYDYIMSRISDKKGRQITLALDQKYQKSSSSDPTKKKNKK